MYLKHITMSFFDSIRFQFGSLPAEERLSILRAESVPLLNSMQGYSALMCRLLAQAEPPAPPHDMAEYCSTLEHQARRLRDLIDACANPQYYKERGRPELRPYDSLLDAVKHTADKLAVPLRDALTDASQVFVHSLYPLVLCNEPEDHREAIVSLGATDYAVQLLEWTDERMFRVVATQPLVSLDAVVRVISQWLIEHWTVEEIDHQRQADRQ